MICQDCGIEAPTKYVSFHQNIGALVMRFSKSVNGNLCKSCIHKHFWSMTGITFVAGWWGTISLIITPFILLNNMGRYVFCLPMAGVPHDATAPVLDEDALKRLQPHTVELVERINDGESFETVAQLIADRAGTTPGQIALYVHALVEAQKTAS